MNWHERYLHQATWTRELRAYAFEKCGWASARRALEVGCGTGAILRNPGAEGNETSLQPELHGLDISEAALIECRTHAAGAHLTCGDVRSLPYASALFDICYCHFLLLWVDDPLLALGEMKRVTVRSGYVLALAEPDYGARTDKPGELAWLGQRQNESLRNQGAALGRGAELAQLFDQAGIRVMETGRIQPPDPGNLTTESWESEWEVLEADLAGMVTEQELRRLRAVNRDAIQSGKRLISVPTYFAWGQV